MVLFLIEEVKPAKKDKQVKYRATASTNVVVVQEASVEELPDESRINEVLSSLSVPNAAPFVVRCDGFINNTIQPNEAEEDDYNITESEPSPMDTLMDHIELSVSRRENVTIVNRGLKSQEHLETLIFQVYKAIRHSAEHGMQVVADEIAKERQIQRLLQLEADEERAGADLSMFLNEGNRDYSKLQGLAMSTRLIQKLKELQKEFPYNANAHLSNHQERFTLLSVDHGDELLPPCKSGSCLVPESFVANPPVYRSEMNLLAGGEGTMKSSASMYQRMRRSTTTVIGELTERVGELEEVAPLPGNGWGDKISFYRFNGENSIMALPGIPKFEDIVKRFAVDFWIRTDCKVVDGPKVLIQIMESREDVGQMFSLTLNFYPEMKETIRLFIRDSQNRVLEGYAQLHETDLTTGEYFHHVMIRVNNLDECNLECIVDNKDLDFAFVQQEHPIGFNSWSHRLFIGGFLDENHAAQSVFRGSIMELRFWAGNEDMQPYIRWPLMVRDGPLLESTKTIPEDHHETLQNLAVVEEEPPKAAPVFDGRLVVNLGPLPIWGQLMHNWRLEIRFRTTCSTRVMTLLGATDRKFKMQHVGIVLNAEPVSSKDRFRFHELNVTFYLVDCFGACCSALFRGTERENLMDGEWHTLVWRCVDAEQNNFIVSVDGVQQSLLFVCREGPNRFAQFDDWICLGGHNVRSWKIQRPFEGEISRFYLSLRGQHYATLDMSEGPGAYVLQDAAGFRNHGLILNADTCAIRKNDVSWVPVAPERDEDKNKIIEIVTYKNNAVSIAAVVFTGEFDENMIPHEVMFDVLSQKERKLHTDITHISDSRSQWGTWACIGEDAYRSLENTNQLEQALNEVIKGELPVGHLMVVIRVGDCHITFLQLLDLPLHPEALYDTNMRCWHFPFSFEGYRGRRELLLHRMIEGVEKVLMADSLTPFTATKLGPLNSGSMSIVPENIARSLRNSGKPWYLPAVLHHNLLNSANGSHLHIIHRFGTMMSFDEAAALCMFNKKLYDRSKELASLVIQRRWRGLLGQKEAVERVQNRNIKNLKVEEIHSIRMDPVVHPKQSLRATLITMHHVLCKAVPPIKETLDEMVALLEKLGYEISIVNDPSPDKLIKILSDLQLDSSSFVYISGYGGQLNMRQAPILSLTSLHANLEEGASRAALCAEEGESFRALMAQFIEDKKNVKGKKKKKSAAPAGRKAQAEFEAMKKQMDALYNEALLEVERDEAFLRDEMDKEHEEDVAAITNEIRNTIFLTNKFLKKYKGPTPAEDPCFLYPSAATTIEPYSSVLLNVEDLLKVALNKDQHTLGFQRVVAIDLQPITPLSQGFACLASSTGNTLRFHYKPQQRCLLSWMLRKALEGHCPTVPATSRFAVLSGGIQTGENERDWKSFATYITKKMKPACATAQEHKEQLAELDRELIPFTAELVPLRDLVMPPEARDRRRRDRDNAKINAVMVFGIGSTRVQSDMFSLFKGILDGYPLSEITFANTIYILFAKKNKNIDALVESNLAGEIEKCRPNHCVVNYTIETTSQGAKIFFDSTESSDKLNINQWIGNMVVRSLSWKIATNPVFSYSFLEVDFIEYVYILKTTCKLRQYRKLKKQMCMKPVPEPYIRFLSVEENVLPSSPKQGTGKGA